MRVAYTKIPAGACFASTDGVDFTIWRKLGHERDTVVIYHDGLVFEPPRITEVAAMPWDREVAFYVLTEEDVERLTMIAHHCRGEAFQQQVKRLVERQANSTESVRSSDDNAKEAEPWTTSSTP